MAMGSTSKVVLSDEMTKAKGVCSDYRAKIAGLVQQVDEAVAALTTNGFQGEAADGFKEFYNSKVKSFFEAGNTFDKYLSMFDKPGEGLFDSIEKALTIGEGLDPELGKNNRTVGQSNNQTA